MATFHSIQGAFLLSMRSGMISGIAGHHGTNTIRSIFGRAAKPTNLGTSQQGAVKIREFHVSSANRVESTNSSRVLEAFQGYDKLKRQRANITLNSDFKEDLGLDFKDVTEIVMEIEDEFEIEMEDEDLKKMTRPQDIVKYIEQHQVEQDYQHP